MAQFSVLQRSILILAALFVISAIALLIISPFNAHAATLTQTLDLGESNGDVRSLQTYLAADATLYPEGLITGYFGPLTQAAVQRLQVREGIVSSGTPETTGYGRVGPKTLARLNVLMGGGVSNVSWDTVPVLSNLNVNPSSTGVTFSWLTNEPTRGEVYWDTTPIQMNEASAPRQSPGASGTLVLDGANLSTSHTITLSGLSPNTTYYYLVRSADSVGNLSMIWPSMFKTDN